MRTSTNKKNILMLGLVFAFFICFCFGTFLVTNAKTVSADSGQIFWSYVFVKTELPNGTQFYFSENERWFTQNGFKNIQLDSNNRVIGAKRYTKCGNPYGVLPTTINGYDELNWTIVVNGQKREINSSTVHDSISDVTITLNIDYHKYPITYKNCEGLENNNPTYHTIECDVNISPISKTGYQFSGWSVLYGEPQVNYVVSKTEMQPVELTANWRANTYYVKFNSNGGVGVMTNESFEYDTSKALTTNAFANGTKNFVGWATTSSGVATYCDGAIVENLTQENNQIVNLYAIWTTETMYQIRFNANGGNGLMNNQPFAYSEQKNIFENQFVHLGFSFVAWNTQSDGSGTSYQNSASVKNLVEDNNGIFDLYAIWTENSYTINFNANGGDGEMESQQLKYTQFEKLKSNGFSKEGMEFACWNTKSDGTGDAYKNGQLISRLTADDQITLYAIWQEPSKKSLSTVAIFIIVFASVVVIGIVVTTILVKKKMND